MTPAEHAKAIERAVEIYSRDFAIYCDTQALTDFRVCSVSLATLQAAIQAGVGAPAQPGVVPGVEAVSEREFKQFLSDVITAAGLVTHGKKCKDLGRRMGEMSMRLLTAPKTAAAPVQAGEYPPSSADMVMAALETEEWGLERIQRCDYISDEGNREGAWLVKRQKAPYCACYTDKPGAPYGPRYWSGPTALDALQKAADDLGIRLPQPAARGAAQAAPVDAAVQQDAERYRWLTFDHADAATRMRVRAVLDRLPVMSYSAACEGIDAARAAQKGTND